MQMTAQAHFLGDAVDGTELSFADVTFEADHSLEVSGLNFEIVHPGAAHTQGDSFVWVPELNVVFTGEIVYVERILDVGEQSSITEWSAALEAVAATGAAHVVPGHGHATTMDRARVVTYE